MDFSLSDEQRELQAIARTFAYERIRPRAFELDRVADPAAAWPGDLFREASRLGLRNFTLPREYGGRGAGKLTEMVVLEELCAGDVSVGSILAHPWREGYVLATATTAEQRERFLKPYLDDDDGMTSLGITEPHSGSDVASGFDADLGAGPMTRAVLDGDEWVVNGRKIYITGGNVARFVIVIARTDPTVPWRQGISAIIVPTDTPGYSCGKVMNKLGLRLNPNTEMTFEDCRVPATNLIGKLNGGFEFMIRYLSGSRAKEGIKALAVARAIHEEAVAWCRDQMHAGKPVIRRQAAADRLIEIDSQIEACRALCWRAGWAVEHDPQDSLRLETMAKIQTTQMAARVAARALELFGGFGVSAGHPIEKFARDAVSLLHTSGGNEAMLAGLADVIYRTDRSGTVQ